MKRVFCIILTCVMLLSTAACSGNPGEKEPETMSQLYFTYPTVQSFTKALQFQTERLDLELPELDLDDSRELMHFYTYKFSDEISLILKEDVSSGTIMNVEIDAPRDMPADNELLSKLMKVVVCCVETNQNEEGVDAIVSDWQRTAIDSAGRSTEMGVVYTVKSFGEDLLLYFVQL